MFSIFLCSQMFQRFVVPSYRPSPKPPKMSAHTSPFAAMSGVFSLNCGTGPRPGPLQLCIWTPREATLRAPTSRSHHTSGHTLGPPPCGPKVIWPKAVLAWTREGPISRHASDLDWQSCQFLSVNDGKPVLLSSTHILMKTMIPPKALCPAGIVWELRRTTNGARKANLAFGSVVITEELVALLAAPFAEVVVAPKCFHNVFLVVSLFTVFIDSSCPFFPFCFLVFQCLHFFLSFSVFLCFPFFFFPSSHFSHFSLFVPVSPFVSLCVSFFSFSMFSHCFHFSLLSLLNFSFWFFFQFPFVIIFPCFTLFFLSPLFQFSHVSQFFFLLSFFPFFTPFLLPFVPPCFPSCSLNFLFLFPLSTVFSFFLFFSNCCFPFMWSCLAFPYPFPYLLPFLFFLHVPFFHYFFLTPPPYVFLFVSCLHPSLTVFLIF